MLLDSGICNSDDCLTRNKWIGNEKVVTAMNKEEGLMCLKTKTVILAMGCRERPRGALNIPGYRPAGIYTAGTAQRLVNMEGLFFALLIMNILRTPYGFKFSKSDIKKKNLPSNMENSFFSM